MRWLVALALVTTTTSALSQGNYRSAPTGGRSALMGNTGVAMGTDGAAPFMNPATVVGVESSLALSLNFVSVDVLHASNWYMPGNVDTATFGNVVKSGDVNITRVAGNAVPSTFCLFAGLPRLGSADPDSKQGTQKLALCLGATERQSFDWIGQGYQSTGVDRSTLQTSSVRFGWQRFVVAPTYAVNVSDAFALGASVHGTFTDFNYLQAVAMTTAGGTLPPTASVYNSGASGTDFGLSAVLGATLRVRGFVFGASIESPDLSVFGHGNVNSYVQFASAANVSATTYLGSGGFHAHEPTRFNVGVGYKWPRGSIEVDAIAALADNEAVQLTANGTQLVVPGNTVTQTALTLSSRFQPTVNVGIGAEIYALRTLSVLGGFGTDFSAIGALTPAPGVAALSQIDRVFWSFGIATHRSGGSLMLGAQLYYGWGQALAPNVYQNPPTLEPSGIDAYGILFVFAGATSLKELTSAVTDIVRPHKKGDDDEPKK